MTVGIAPSGFTSPLAAAFRWARPSCRAASTSRSSARTRPVSCLVLYCDERDRAAAAEIGSTRRAPNVRVLARVRRRRDAGALLHVAHGRSARAELGHALRSAPRAARSLGDERQRRALAASRSAADYGAAISRPRLRDRSLRLGGRSAAAPRAARRDHLRDCTSVASRATPRRASRIRARSAASPRRSRISRRSASPTSSCCRSWRSTRRTCRLGVAARGLGNYWGYSPVGFFAPHAAVRADRRCAHRVPGHGQGAAPGRHRRDSRRRVQSHGRGRRGRRHDRLQRARQRVLLPSRSRGPKRIIATTPVAAIRSIAIIRS